MVPQRTVQFLYHADDLAYAQKYVQELQRRNLRIEHVESRRFVELLEGVFPLSDVGVIAFTSNSIKDGEFLLNASALCNRYRDSWRTTLLILDSCEVPVPLRWLPRVQADFATFDLSFENLLSFVLGPLPEWLHLYCRPSQMRNPTGAAWWTDDIVVADEYYGHLLKVKRYDTSVLLAGLDEPYHVHLDRRALLVANPGANEVICARLQDGSIAGLRTVKQVLGKKLKRPHGVFQGNKYSLIADTDNQRVLWKSGDFNDRQATWSELSGQEFSFPCGVYGGGDSAWIADTFNHRILRVELSEPAYRGYEIGGASHELTTFSFPVSVCTWNDLLFVSDEQNKRLQVLRFSQEKRGSLLRTCSLAGDFIGSPMGVAVNRSNCVLVADRDRGCCWVIELAACPVI